eukprot:TRINITY_DN27709_c0_g1_i1.p1 TRINITY_DN27709_c0_g1~~TRINITY_DN27709_c0_g1_i1.p1  ORF type:complete len:382 (+),score=75.67 TRINITY_DN27709_c0_g1_i1:158-1303(+)
MAMTAARPVPHSAAARAGPSVNQPGITLSQMSRPAQQSAGMLRVVASVSEASYGVFAAGVLLATASQARQRSGIQTACRGSSSRLPHIVRASSSSDDASTLEREAAKLRAEAMELEKSKAVDRRKARAEQLLGAGNRAGSLDAAGLAKKLKEVEEVDFSEDEAKKLIAACSTKDTVCYEDVESEAFEATFDKLAKEQGLRLSAELAERQQQLAAEAEREKAMEAVTGLFSSKDAEGDIGVRITATLPYLLPLVDMLPYGIGLAYLFPPIQILFIVASPLLALKNAIPFGTFIFLIGFQYLCRNEELPGLVRYNLRQATVLDILAILPSWIIGFMGIRLPEGLDMALFVLILFCLTYSLVLTALGKLPDGLGFVSDATKRGL